MPSSRGCSRARRGLSRCPSPRAEGGDEDPALDCRRNRLYGNELREFVEDWDLRTRGLDMTVPERLFTAPFPVVAAYLRSVFQAEGYVRQGAFALVGFDMISEGIVRGAQTLLARFGIFSRVRFKADNRPDAKGAGRSRSDRWVTGARSPKRSDS